MSRSRFDKFWQAFRLTRYPSSITRATDQWYEVRSFYDAVNTNFDNSFIAGRKLVADEIMCSWHGMSVSYDTEGAPHVTKIARKPEGIGIELKALACGESGVILKLEVMEGKDEMHKKLIDTYNAGTSCLLRLTDSDNIRSSYRTLIADSGFGSVEAVTALMLERGLYVMAAVKTAHSYFPLKYIQSWSKQSGRERGDYIVLKSTYLDNNGEFVSLICHRLER